MSVLTTDSRVAHAADGVAAAFAYHFRVLEAGDLKVALRDAGTGAETPQTLNTHYTVTGVGAPMGGTVVFPAPPPMGQLVVVARAMPAGDHGYPDQPAEAAFDRLTLLAQQIQDQANRAVRFPEGDNPSLSAQLPASTARAGKALAFDGYGNVTLVSLASPTFDSGMVEWAEVHNTPTTLAGYGIADGAPLNHVGAGGGAHALASATGAGFMAAADKAKLDGIPAGGGPYVSVKAFGAVGNGVVNDYAAVQAALSSVAGGGTIFFPDGVYQIGAALSVPAGVTLLGTGGRAVIRPATALESLLRVTGDGVRLIGLGFANMAGRAPRAVRLGDTGSPPGRPATARDVRIRDCRFQDFGQAVVVWDVEDVSVDGCSFTGCGTAFLALDNGSGTRFVGNLIRGGSPGIAFERSADGGQAAQGVVIAHNRIEAGGGSGVSVKGGDGFVIAANAITEVGGWAVELDGSACAVASMRVADNWIIGGGSGGGTGGILLKGDCRGAGVTGNSVAAFAGHGLSAAGEGVVDARIVNNVFDRIATADIDLDGAQRTVVSGNECRANGGASARPLVERGAGTRSIVTHNSFGGSGPLRSAGSLYSDNFGDDLGDDLGVGPIGGVGRVRGCRLSFGDNQPVEPGADVRLAWTAVEWDSDGGLDPAQPERIRVPAWARLARVTARLEFQGGGVVGGRILRCNAEGESPVGVTVSRTVPWIPVAPGDWFEIGARNDGEVALELAGSGVGWVQVEFA